MPDEIVHTSEPKSVRKARRKAKLEQERNDAELSALVDIPGGAYFIWRLLCECGIYQAAPPGEEDMARFEGRRDIGLWLMEQLTGIDEKLYQKIRNIGAYRDKGSDLNA